MKKKAIVAGAGIAGLALARALYFKGYHVTVIEKNERAVGASIRNFGMVWPIGQPAGELYENALRTKTIWKEVAESSRLWYHESGSLHTAYYEDEWQVLQELYELFIREGRPVQLLHKDAITARFTSVNPNHLIGGLYSETELIVDPRAAIPAVASYFQEQLGIQFIWGKAVTQVETGKVYSGNELFEADIIFICSGADFECLYPELFQQTSITKCKLQMMRFKSDDENFSIGTSLCGGLSLIHYNSFKAAPSLAKLRNRYEAELPDYIAHGIHVMVSQNNLGELTVGDSHEYGLTFDPFDAVSVYELIQKYLSRFAVTSNWKLIQTWNGIYPKMLNGQTQLFLQADKDVYIFNGLGGTGMTMSFGLAEKCIAGL